MRSVAKNLRALPLIAALVLAGCSTFGSRDEFPMRNPKTGAETICRSGTYLIEESSAQLEVAMQCIHACERYGFRQYNGNIYIGAPQPQTPRDDMKSEIPSACLP